MGMLGLAALPTCFIGLNSDVKPVQASFTSHGEPSKYAIRPVTKPPEKVSSFILTFHNFSLQRQPKKRMLLPNCLTKKQRQ